MNQTFIILITYQGNEHEFKARFEHWGYTHRIAVLVDETTYTFEPDEEGGYRALNFDNATEVPVGLLQAIAKKLVKLID
jgi:hypothetical protein